MTARFFILICLMFSASADAQNSMPNLPQFGGGNQVRSHGIEPPIRRDLITVTSTRPIARRPNSTYGLMRVVEGTFRIAFRVMANQQEVPISTIGYGGWRSDFILDWTAFTSNGARCNVIRQNLIGIDVFSGGTIGAADSIRSLLESSGAGSVASSTRPTIISADFDCDGAVRPGDSVSIQIKIFTLGYPGWTTATYSSENQQVLSGR